MHPTPRLLRRQQIILGRMGRVEPPSETASGRIDPAPEKHDAEAESEPAEDLRADPVATQPAGSESPEEHSPHDAVEERAESSSRVDDRAPEPLEARPFPTPAPRQNP
jgi:hypothetical protein